MFFDYEFYLPVSGCGGCGLHFYRQPTSDSRFPSAKLNAKNVIPPFCHVFCFFLNFNSLSLTAIYDLTLGIKKF
jgi:hypothetical protein